jgi:hypothetical protein
MNLIATEICIGVPYWLGESTVGHTEVESIKNVILPNNLVCNG